jgi:crossover junction endodeoxyribonuclease RusA
MTERAPDRAGISPEILRQPASRDGSPPGQVPPDLVRQWQGTVHAALAAQQPRTWVIELPAGIELLNANQRHSWRYKARVTAELRRTAGWAARAARVPRLERAHVLAEYQPPDGRRRDPANWYPSFKACIDGLIDAGVLPDDDAAHLDGPDMRLGEPYPKGRLVLTVTELPGGER